METVNCNVFLIRRIERNDDRQDLVVRAADIGRTGFRAADDRLFQLQIQRNDCLILRLIQRFDLSDFVVELSLLFSRDIRLVGDGQCDRQLRRV